MSFSDRINNWFGSNETYEDYDVPPESENDTKVMSLVSARKEMEAQKEHKIILFEPRVFSDVKVIGNHLLNGEPAIINFQRMEEDQALRIVDFLSGIVFAQNGDIKRIGEQIFLCTPEQYRVEGDLTDSLARKYRRE
ncbi:cell division protein SepF [Ligilactobacillus saerimneri]|uniref:cell division protein SepF n=1 Tax=Ligilactobacillus saerimneri TaxID=228229 RepID=UPI0030D51DEC